MEAMFHYGASCYSVNFEMTYCMQDVTQGYYTMHSSRGCIIDKKPFIGF